VLNISQTCKYIGLIQHNSAKIGNFYLILNCFLKMTMRDDKNLLVAKVAIMIVICIIIAQLVLAKGFAKTITVDDDLLDFPKADYIRIKDALKNANNGDRIVVYSGKYPEYLEIQKSVELIGIGYPEVLGIEIKSDKVLVKGFYITFSGIQIRSSKSGIVDGNKVSCPNRFSIGIQTVDIADYKIVNNTLQCAFGIVVKGHDNIIKNNTILWRVPDTFPGIWIQGDNNEIVLNTIKSKSSGISVDGNGNILWGNIVDSSSPLATAFDLDGSYNFVFLNSFKFSKIFFSGENNRIFLNNFICDNKDFDINFESNNFWNTSVELTYSYNGKTFVSRMGNYWNKPNRDADHNGIGEIPIGKDYYPLMEPVYVYNYSFYTTKDLIQLELAQSKITNQERSSPDFLLTSTLVGIVTSLLATKVLKQKKQR